MAKYLCPKCKSPLIISGKSYKCEQSHCYDIAKEGYVNLLLPNMKNSKEPGDNVAMSRARFDFLERGIYAPMAEEILRLVADKCNSAPCVLDAGCGSGYYDRVLCKALTDAEVYGVDLSKEAVKLASKHNKTSFYAVAGVYDLPFPNEVFDAVLCVFAPHAFSEYRRVLKKGGVLIVAYPDKEHLLELKQLLYGTATYENEKTLTAEGIILNESRRVKYVSELDGDSLNKLLQMTPYFYTTEKSALERMNDIKKQTITFDFKIDVFIKE